MKSVHLVMRTQVLEHSLALSSCRFLDQSDQSGLSFRGLDCAG